MNLFQVEKLPLRLMIYGFVIVYVALDIWIGGPIYKWISGNQAGSDISQQKGIENDWAATVNGEPITKAQLDAMVNLELARRGEQREEIPESRLGHLQLATLKTMLTDELVFRWYLHPANKEDIPEDLVRERVQEFEGSLLPDELETVTEANRLTNLSRRQLLRTHAAQHYWVEKKIEDALTVREQELRRWYEAWEEKLRIPEVVRARHIFLSTLDQDEAVVEARIREIHQQLEDESATFANLAAELSEDERSRLTGGDLGWFTKARLPDDFGEAVFALEPGQLSAPFRSKLGWHIVEVTERQEERPATYEEMRAELHLWLENQQRQDAIRDFREQLNGRNHARKELFPAAGELTP